MTEPTTSTTITNCSPVATAVPRFSGGLAVSREIRDASRGHLPLTVWLGAADGESVATCGAGCCHPVSGPLARHLVSVCARLGETVVHLGASDHQLVSAALTAGCLPVAVFADAARAGVTWTRLARTHPDYDLEITDLRIAELLHDEVPLLDDLIASAGLVVTEQSCNLPGRCPVEPCAGGEADVYDVASAARLVKPGGHLVVVTGLHRQVRVVDPMPEIITQAREAGLVYLQHIVALRQPARGERIDPGLSRRGLAATQNLPACADLPASARAHSDVLLFSRPKRLSEPHGPEALPTSGAGSLVDTDPTAQAGDER